MPNIPDTLITTYLELYPETFKPSFIIDDRIAIRQVVAPDIRYYRFMYNCVGEQWNWTDRLLLEDDEIRSILEDPNMSMYVLYYDGAPAGYIELVRCDPETTEIKYFGLREPFWGRGLGKHLLSWGVATALEGGAQRVILDTCNLDGPHALRNYKKRGFRVYNVSERPMPDKEYIKLTAAQRGLAS
jgi:GNAT superfamily N-acetyltransferase